MAKTVLNVLKVANTLALLIAIAYIICALFLWISPSLTTSLGNYLFHGIDLSSIITARTISFTIRSIITGTITAWITGALFALIYNRL